MPRVLIVLCAVALLAVPGSGQAKESEQTVRLVIECSPKTADAIQHLLKGLPAKVYRAVPVDSDTQRARAGIPAQAKATLRRPTGVVSVLPIWKAIDKALEDTDGASLERLTVSSRSARMTFTVRDETVFQKLRTALASGSFFRMRARDKRNVVEPGAVHRSTNGLRGDLTINFREMPNDTNGRTDTPGIDQADVSKRAAAANLKTLRVGAERRDQNKASGTLTVYSEWVFEETSLPNLKKFLASLDKAPGLTPTEIRWQLRDPKKRANDPTLIQKPSVKIAQWLGN